MTDSSLARQCIYLFSRRVFASHRQWRSDGVGGVQGAPEFQAKKNKNNFPVTVEIRTSGYQTLECFIATLATQVRILVLSYSLMGVLYTCVKLSTDLQILGCEMHKNAFDGRALPRPTGGATQNPWPL